MPMFLWFLFSISYICSNAQSSSLQNPSLKCWEKIWSIVAQLNALLNEAIWNKNLYEEMNSGRHFLCHFFSLSMFPPFFSLLLCVIIYFVFLNWRTFFSRVLWQKTTKASYITHSKYINSTARWNANPYNRIIIVYLHWNCTHGFVITLINLDLNVAKIILHGCWVNFCDISKEKLNKVMKTDCSQAIRSRGTGSLISSGLLSLLSAKIIHIVAKICPF